MTGNPSPDTAEAPQQQPAASPAEVAKAIAAPAGAQGDPTQAAPAAQQATQTTALQTPAQIEAQVKQAVATQKPSPEESLKKNKRASMLDGAASSVMEGVSTGYATPFAIALNATNAQIGLLTGIAVLLGSLVQPLGADLVERVNNRRKVIVYTVVLQALFWLAIAALPFLIAPGNDAATAFIVLFAIMTAFGSIGGPAWNSLMADVIPPAIRGEFFGRRNELLRIVTLVTLFAFGWFLSLTPGQFIFYGFAALFAIACVSRLVSAHYLNAMEYPNYEHTQTSESLASFVASLPRTEFGKLALFLGVIVFATNIASPFFQVYVLRNLGYDYSVYAVFLAINAAAAILTFAYWGKLSDSFGNKKILYATGVLVPLIPVAYFFAANPIHVAFAEALSGFAWAGFNLATFNYVLEFSPAYNRARYIAYYNVLIGVATFAGALAGAFMLDHQVAAFGMVGIPLVFALSAVTRLLSVAVFLPLVADSKPIAGLDNRRFFINAVINYPMNGVRSSVVSGWSSMVAVEKKAVETTRWVVGEVGRRTKKGERAIKQRFYLEE